MYSLLMRMSNWLGIITERDLIRHVSGQRAAPSEFKVEQVMTADPEMLRASDPIAFALNLMHLGHFRHLASLCLGRPRRGVPHRNRFDP